MKKKLVLIFLSVIIISCNVKESVTKETVTDYVDPFIGTGGHGHTFPGAMVPFGMVQLSPDNPSKGWDWTSGYHYSDSVLLGFSHTHLSGTGVGDLYDILVMPFVSEYPQNRNNEHKRLFETYSHENEDAEPGYYSLELDNSISAELTATERIGFHRYSFPEKSKAQILLDLGYAQNFDTPVETFIKIIDNKNVVGYRKSKGWAEFQPVYFAIEFLQPFKYRLYADGIEVAGNKLKEVKTECVFEFTQHEAKDIMMKVSISSASIKGAQNNISVELPNWEFSKTRAEAKDKWEKELGMFSIKSDNNKAKRIFYTALYHSYMAPYLFSDVNSEYYGADGKTAKAKGYTKYTLFSLWDTFRALHPMLTFTQPQRIDDFVKSLLSFYDEKGLLPTWDLVSNETDVMIGYHAVPVIVDAYLKGLTSADPDKIWEAITASANQNRFGIDHYRKYGYIPSELEVEAVSKTLEYAVDDWCIAQMADALGKDEEYMLYMKRADSYKELFDESTGFMRGKDKNGNWVKDFSPIFVEHRKTDYTEGNAWQYTWHVMHDVEGLINLYGNEEKFITKLDSLFVISSEMEGDELSPDISGLIGQYAHGNEPGHHIPYLYSFTKQPWKGQKLISEIREVMYNDTPEGLVGNDDCGQMSAWYILSALGFYQVNPADGKFYFGTPLFEEVKINLKNGKTFVVIAENVSSKNIYINSTKLNGKLYESNFIDYTDIMNGGVLEFKMSDKF